MQVICVVNHKGGVAKTTMTVNLAGALREQKRHVLVMDLDPQASASVWLGVRDSGKDLLEAVVTGEGFADLVRHTVSEIDLVPCGPAFASVENVAADKEGTQLLLRDAMGGLPAEWDFVLLDCPPSLSLITVNALVASDQALVPVVAEVLSLDPLARLLDTMWQVRGRFNPDLQLNGMFATRVDTRSAHSEEVTKVLTDQFGDMVYQVMIRENVHLAQAAGFQKPVTEYQSSSHGSEDYRALAREFIARAKKHRAKQRSTATKA